MEWADALVWRGVLSLPPSPDVEAAFRDRLAHVHVVQRAFLQLWQKAPVTALAEAEKLTDLAGVLGWTRSVYPEGRTTIAALGIADFDRTVAAYNEHWASERPLRADYRMVARDGSIVWIHDEAFSMIEAAPSGPRRVSQGLVVDTTEQKRLEEQLLHGR